MFSCSDPEHDDQRRRYYGLTRLGRRVAIAEARRLERLLADTLLALIRADGNILQVPGIAEPEFLARWMTYLRERI